MRLFGNRERTARAGRFLAAGLILLGACALAFSADAAKKPASSASPSLALAGPYDWAQWCGSPQKNNTPEGTNIPSDWDIGKLDRKTGKYEEGTSRNIKWAVQLGTQTFGN